MRIAHVLPNLLLGGRERMAIQLASAQARAGMTPVIIGYEPALPALAQLEPNAQYIQLDRRQSGFTKDLRERLRQQDIVHAQGHISAHVIRSAGPFGRPAIATMHVGMDQNWRWLWPIRQGLRAMNGLTAVSAPLAKTYGRLSGRPVATIANGIDLTGFSAHSAPAPRAGEPFRFAMLSRLHPVKRHEDALRAMAMLTQQGLQSELHIGGEGSELPKLQALAQALLLHEHVRFAGAVSDVPAFFADKHAFLLPSLREGMPLAMIEAMAAGLPVIASDLSGVRAIAAEGAMLTPPAKPAELADAMQHMIKDRDSWDQRAAASIAAAQHFSLEQMHDRYARLYQEMLAA